MQRNGDAHLYYNMDELLEAGKKHFLYEKFDENWDAEFKLTPANRNRLFKTWKERVFDRAVKLQEKLRALELPKEGIAFDLSFDVEGFSRLTLRTSNGSVLISSDPYGYEAEGSTLCIDGEKVEIFDNFYEMDIFRREKLGLE